MSKRSDKVLLIDIREAVEKILVYTAGISGGKFYGERNDGGRRDSKL